ncbi:enoyl-CoA hydratase [Sphingomonas sp. MG17]|uniref:Enoyl-CoA hydratase n=1 Tax=Sphingomonas tagetis TaxID=2949092 RepID=A0A9X2HMP4_9SPHN|nr:enoyl-CoA hydratase [Sphingomonas tagetis]
MEDQILTRKDGAIGRIIFNNPAKMNAISLGMWEGMGKAMKAFEADDEVRVVVFSGAGGKAFVAGADVSKYAEERGAADAQEHYARTGEDALQAIYTSKKVTVAAIDGYCIGGGVSVALVCDLRYCSAKSSFGQPAMNIGIGYRYSSLRRMVDIIGYGAAKDMLLGGLRFTAQEAYIKGLVGRVLPDDEFDQWTEKTVTEISVGAPLTAEDIKYTLWTYAQDEAKRDTDRCEELFQICYASADYKEGIAAFAEKRKPVFTGN